MLEIGVRTAPPPQHSPLKGEGVYWFQSLKRLQFTGYSPRRVFIPSPLAGEGQGEGEKVILFSGPLVSDLSTGEGSLRIEPGFPSGAVL